MKSEDFSDLWNTITRLLGIKVTKEDKPRYVEHIREMTAYLQNDYPGWTKETVELAYRLGVKELLSKYNGETLEMFAELNPRSLGKVLAAYDRFRKEKMLGFIAPEHQLPAGEDLLPPPTESELDQMNAQLFRVAYQQVLHSGKYHDIGNALYDWLDSKGLVSFTNERKWDFMLEAQQEIKRRKHVEGVAGNEQRHKDARLLVDILNQAIEAHQIYLPIESQIKTKAKHLAFIALVLDLIEMGINDDEFLANLCS